MILLRSSDVPYRQDIYFYPSTFLSFYFSIFSSFHLFLYSCGVMPVECLKNLQKKLTFGKLRA